ncbi:MAG: hypothetical protein QY330_02500 [Candidatus Dojkabacteria bacterium]|uniref:Uncharacterized protein n=1 Tax=Candidatus Dojkabacteria bacterium TaxID=2099670 RepID=A0A952DVE6_9BACT|nr:hypothetical protein [Candidatus Dojkabacteria bacterium]WKZ28446.1 MAG: hypothetical protein QY330_02500 [Candidatus Dojkabacteria bacterium]
MSESFSLATLLDFNRLLELDPAPTEFQQLFYFVAIGFLLISLVARIFIVRNQSIDAVYRVLIRDFFKRNIWIGIALAIFALSRDQGIRFLEMRLWPVLTSLLFIANFVYLVYQLASKEPKKKEQIKRVTEYQKYLPKKKKS